MSAQIILASASPRRRELLEQIGVSYLVTPVDLDETPLVFESPLAYVQRIRPSLVMAGFWASPRIRLTAWPC